MLNTHGEIGTDKSVTCICEDLLNFHNGITINEYINSDVDLEDIIEDEYLPRKKIIPKRIASVIGCTLKLISNEFVYRD